MMIDIYKRFSSYVSRYLSTRVVFFLDLILSTLSSFATICISSFFSQQYPIGPKMVLIWCIAAFFATTIALFIVRSYKIVIRHSTIRDLNKFPLGTFLKQCMIGVVILIIFQDIRFVFLFGLLLCDFFITLFVIIGVRIIMIFVYNAVKSKLRENQNCIRLLVYGITDKSVAAIQRFLNSSHYEILGFICEENIYKDLKIMNLPVYCIKSEDDLRRVSKELNLGGILFSSENSVKKVEDSLIKFSLNLNVKILLIPSVDEIDKGNTLQYRIREIKIEDLLGRDEIKFSCEEIKKQFAGKVVLVTGAAGSIGSELCRQLVGFGISKLILFDNAETPMHNIRLELEQRFKDLNFIPVIGDVRNIERLDFVFRANKPDVVFHAAAYKHVPLMEENPCEAVRVNVMGSKNVADKCLEYGVQKMIMISTDKAVNPTNIMGCSKRLAEIYVQSLGLALENGSIKGQTQFITTRFGNVLGSNGSVIPRFRQQIEQGGPVTVTDPNINRFFMTIPEACRLVMEASVISKGNQIVVFDMGKPVKIDDLAHKMIELAGFVPDKDIKIIYTGLRPGEKLYEEVLSNAENTEPTNHDRIRIAKVRQYDYNEANTAVVKLSVLATQVEIPEMVKLMKCTVPEFKSKNSPFEVFDKADC